MAVSYFLFSISNNLKWNRFNANIFNLGIARRFEFLSREWRSGYWTVSITRVPETTHAKNSWSRCCFVKDTFDWMLSKHYNGQITWHCGRQPPTSYSWYIPEAEHKYCDGWNLEEFLHIMEIWWLIEEPARQTESIYHRDTRKLKTDTQCHSW